MSVFDGLLSKLGSAAAELAERFIPGSKQAVEAAKSIAAAFESAKQLNGGAVPVDAQAKHDALLAKVKAHASSTFDRLEGR